MTPPLLGLVIMIKDGSSVIESTLRAIHPYIDHWDILDTGSTDGTQQIIREILNSPVDKISYDFTTDTYSTVTNTVIPGTLWEEPFINFRESRNRLLDLAGTTCTFTIMLDDSYIVYGGKKLLKILTIARNRGIKSLSIKITSDSICYPSERILRSEYGTRYKRRIHEIPDSLSPPVTIQDDSIYIYDFEEPITAVRSQKRYEKDAEWLLQDCLDDPNDTRTWFYLSRTYALLECHEEANACLLKRISMMDLKTRDEEAFICMMDIAVCHQIGFKTPWAIVEQLYLDAYTYLPHRAEPLYAIGMHYYDLAHIEGFEETYDTRIGKTLDRIFAPDNNDVSIEKGVPDFRDIKKYLVTPENTKIIADARAVRMGNMNKAYVFIKAASKLPFPDLDYLFVERSVYEFQVPEKLAIIAVNLGKWKVAKKAAEKALRYNPFKDSNAEIPDNTNLKLILAHCNRELHIFADEDTTRISNLISTTGKTMVINCGNNSYHDNWGPTTPGLGGSETMVVGMAEQFAARDFNVYVFSNVTNGEQHNGVTYFHSDYYDLALKCIKEHGQKIDILLISRYADCLRYDADLIRKQFLWIHDAGIIANGETKIELLKIDSFLVLSEWHRSIISSFGIPLNKLVVTRNAIDPAVFANPAKVAKVPYRFIYSSCLTRGLEAILDMWPAVRRKIPAATLHIFADFTPFIQRQWGAEKVEAFRHRVAYMKTMGVTMTARLSKQELATEFLKASVWFYPTEFEETYCITALEAMAAGCICICSDLAALKETCGDGRAHLIDPETYNAVNLVETLKTNDPKMQERARNWALSQSYDNLYKEWSERIVEA